ncbi:MAG TPA: penicillin acylase family protein [Cyclobacteriaceae bacterium]|nr:penicillin acylase family protein [Cyclobacteriaceae bacterium]
MKKLFYMLISIFVFACAEKETGTSLYVAGLRDKVEIIRDSVGVNHIYAKNEHDLFFAQGYAAAKDRLFQFEIWRRRASGTVAEILGEREIKRDIGARLFQFRGDVQKEMQHYHPHGVEIITAFVDGVNACIKEINENPEELPIEFKLLGIKPGYWTPEIVVSRHQGLVGNATDELDYVRALHLLGEEKVKALLSFEPGVPELKLDSKINPNWLMQDGILDLYQTYRSNIKFLPEDLIAAIDETAKQTLTLELNESNEWEYLRSLDRGSVGSNNWVISGTLTESGYPMMANDPHRALAAPALRYMVHLNAPGWDVMGGGEPVIPGISIGHNGTGAWGLTVFETDNEDIYVYQLNPENKNQYRYKDAWESFEIISDTIKVKNADAVIVQHKYTRHGPVTFVDEQNNTAFALRCAWLEIGSAPYLASLRMNQASTWEEFREACTYSFIPGENMVWADKNGNIGWQAVGIAPIRKNWNGLLPVPGDGTYEWSGYLPVKELPNQFNPASGFIVTANENLIPENYPHRNAVGWEWADAFRGDRIREVLSSGNKFSMDDMIALQHDYLSLPARALIPFLENLTSAKADAEQARKYLMNWNFILDNDSPAAPIYMMWERKIRENLRNTLVPEKAKPYIRSIALSRSIEIITKPENYFGQNAVQVRDQILMKALEQAIDELRQKLGDNMPDWKYADNNYHHAWMKHPLSAVLEDDLRKKLDLGPVPRKGSASTPGATGSGNLQTHGASFRAVIDTKDFDGAMFNNAPGQSGNPESIFYRNLFSSWADDTLLPVPFSKERVRANAYEKFLLQPVK